MAGNTQILIIDDDVMNLKITQGLVSAPYKGIGVKTGEMALRFLEKNTPALILLSMEMTDDDPAEILEDIKNCPSGNHIPILMMAEDEPGDDEQAKCSAGGAAGFMVKPFTAEDLQAKCKELLPPVAEPIVHPDDGIPLCGNQEVYKDVARTYIETWKEERDAIAAYCESGDVENYTIKVHALKNAAKLIGAMKLSEDSFYLEKCGKEKNLDEIRNRTDSLLTMFDQSVSELKGIING